jgi:hypothetical protein
MAMAINTYGDLKTELTALLFHARLLPRYDNCTQFFEASANSRLRVLPMEAMELLTTVNGDAALPPDYLTWRTVRPTLASPPDTLTFHPPYDELDYVHPAYLPPVGRGLNRVFTVEGNTFKVRPVDDRPDAYELHYYQKIPSLTGSDLNTNWLLTNYPNVYVFGVLVELAAVQRNTEMAQLYKARRDEVFEEIIRRYALTTGATAQTARTGEYF